MRKWLMAVIFGTVLVLGACGGGDDGGSNDEPADNGDETAEAPEAEVIYKDNCATCHGNDLSGETGPDLTEVGNRLSQDQIEEVIEDGKGAMPSGLVGGQDLPTLAKWLSEIK